MVGVTFLVLGIIIQQLIIFMVGIFAIIVSPVLLYLSTTAQIAHLTSERIIVQNFTIFEKITKIPREEIASIDNIAVIKHGRAPFNKGALTSGIGLSLLNAIILVVQLVFFPRNLNKPVVLFILIIGMIILISFSVGLIIFGLRFKKRSLELHVIGVNRPIVIGTRKGVPKWFVQKVQQSVFERTHHFSHLTEVERMIREFPLETSTILKETLARENKELHKKIIVILDREPSNKKELMKKLPEYSEIEIEEALRQLTMEGLIKFYGNSKKWRTTWNSK